MRGGWRVLAVDDSGLCRRALTAAAASVPGVAETIAAADGEEALCAFRALRPDAVLLDLELPGIGGIQVLRRIMREGPVPVIIVTATAPERSEVAYQAFECGAAAFVCKGDGSGDPEAFRARVREALGRALPLADPLPRVPPAPPPPHARPAIHRAAHPLVVLGASTGGPPALQAILADLPPDLAAPVAVVQHIPPAFVAILAGNLERAGRMPVVAISGRVPLRPGHVYLSADRRHLRLGPGRDRIWAWASEAPAGARYRPSVDVTFADAADLAGPWALAVVLSGMGCDGADGAEAIKARGGRVICQDEASSAVFGMPAEVVRRRLADDVVGVEGIARAVTAFVDRPSRNGTGRGHAPAGR